MKSAKKLLAVLLAAALVMLAGCSSPGSASSAASGGQTPSSGGETAPDAASAAAADFPNKTIQIICPVKAGGDTDRNARSLAQAMQKYLNATVIVTNVDGGATVMGMQQCLQAKADGYTLVVNGTDIFVPNMMGTTDITLDSFKSVAIPAIDNSTVLAVNKDSGYKDLKDLVEKSQAKPDSIEYGGKIGATNQMCGVAMNLDWGSKFKFVDVGNNAAKVTALLAKQTDVINISYSVAKDYFTSGQFVALCLLGSQKNDQLSEIPLASEFGYKDIDFSKFFWVGAPPETPDSVVKVLADAIEKASKDPDFVKDMEANYLTPTFYGQKDAQDFAENFYNTMMLPYKDAFLAAQ